MSNADIQLLFGANADELHRHYRRLNDLHRMKTYLLENIRELEAELAQMEKSTRDDLDAKSRESVDLSNQVDELRTNVSSLKIREKQLRELLNSLPHRLLAALLALLSPTRHPGIPAMRVQHGKMRDKLHEQEAKLLRMTDDLKQQERLVKSLARPMGSHQFAINKLMANVNEIHEKARGIHGAIDQMIIDKARFSSFRVLTEKHGKFVRLGSDPTSVIDLLRLKSAADRLCQLQALPELSARENHYVEVEQIRSSIDTGMKRINTKVRGALTFAGKGTAHKKVSSGKSTKWKEVDVNFSGDLLVERNISYRSWQSAPLVRQLTEFSDDHFHKGILNVRKSYVSPLLNELSHEVSELVTIIRSRLEQTA